jgi:hypothetical protein
MFSDSTKLYSETLRTSFFSDVFLLGGWNENSSLFMLSLFGIRAGPEILKQVQDDV